MKLSLSAGTSGVKLAHIVIRGDVDGALSQAAELGYSGVDLFLRDSGEVSGEALLRASNESGIRVVLLSALGDLISAGVTLGSPDKGLRRRFLERANAHLELAAQVGALVPIGYSRGAIGPDRSADAYHNTLVESLVSYDALAARHGVRLVIEPINRYEIDSVHRADEAVRLIERGGLRHTGVLLDLFHMNIEEASISDAIRISAPYLFHVHFADNNRLAPGMGHTDMGRYYREMVEAGYCGYFGVEVLPLPDMRAAAAQALGFFDTVSNGQA